MSGDLGPLLLLWLVARARTSSAAPSPRWPTALSPPPPPPPPLPPDASPAEALADMVKARNTLYQTVKKAGPKKTITDVLRPKAKKLKPIVVTATPKKALPKFLDYTPDMDVSVADVQKALIKRGASLKPDGLYGPKTQQAWIATTKKWKLPTYIQRLTGKIARVNRSAFLALTDPNRAYVP